MSWLLRLAALLAAFFLLRELARWLWRLGWDRFLSSLRGRLERASPPLHQGIIKRDPICGTYVDVEVSVQASKGGEILHFCSERCRDAYRARPPDGQAQQPVAVPKAR